MSQETELDKIAKASEQAYHEQQAIIFAEQAAGRLAEVFGGSGAVRILRALAQHLEDFG